MMPVSLFKRGRKVKRQLTLGESEDVFQHLAVKLLAHEKPDSGKRVSYTVNSKNIIVRNLTIKMSTYNHKFVASTNSDVCRSKFV